VSERDFLSEPRAAAVPGLRSVKRGTSAGATREGAASWRPGGERETQRELRAALRYERGLVWKALAALALVAVIVILRTLYFS